MEKEKKKEKGGEPTWAIWGPCGCTLGRMAMWGLVPHGLAKGKAPLLPPIKGGAPLPFFPSQFSLFSLFSQSICHTNSNKSCLRSSSYGILPPSLSRNRTKETPEQQIHATMPRSYSSDHDAESGYASGSSSASLPEVYFSRPHLKFINQQLQNLEPQGKIKIRLRSQGHFSDANFRYP